jgi:adenylate kinase family enzyme
VARIALVGNRGGGKSTLARRVAERQSLLHVEIDRWPRLSAAAYAAEHARLLAQDAWLIDGLGRRESIPARLLRASEIILIDLPLWMHAALAPVDGPATGELIAEIERDWMPDIRRLCTEAERRGIPVVRLESTEAVERFGAAI